MIISDDQNSITDNGVPLQYKAGKQGSNCEKCYYRNKPCPPKEYCSAVGRNDRREGHWVLEVPKLNLNNCKTGDTVTTRDGCTGVYQGREKAPAFEGYPHAIIVQYKSGICTSLHFTDNGQYIDGQSHCLDIVSVTATPTKEKTVREWFEGVTQYDLRRRLLLNLKPCYTDIMTDNLASAINRGFAWAESPEGPDYWCGAYIMAQEVAP